MDSETTLLLTNLADQLAVVELDGAYYKNLQASAKACLEVRAGVEGFAHDLGIDLEYHEAEILRVHVVEGQLYAHLKTNGREWSGFMAFEPWAGGVKLGDPRAGRIIKHFLKFGWLGVEDDDEYMDGDPEVDDPQWREC